ncbi:MAG TPA: site-specific DNA-methyltransferase [Lacipirellulaceae bacterium]|nr:site-specific DNA-methyltransferase [Lacipirellulaceae bacterium]
MAKKKAAAAPKTPKTGKTVATITHDGEKRKNIPTAEYQSVVAREHAAPVRVKYPRNVDLDPQLVWRGKDEQDWSDLVVHAPPLYIQEKVHPKVLVDDLLRQTQAAREAAEKSAGKLEQLDLFADFNGVPEGDAKTEFYQHDQNWSNRMILGDPPYGIKFNSNFQWSTTSRDVKDGKADHITREPEQVKAFRDTWRDGIHSYLTYLRDRLTVARDLLIDSGSIFVQIGDENMHRVRTMMDEVFGEQNFRANIILKKTSGLSRGDLPTTVDYLLGYGKSEATKYRQLFYDKSKEAAVDPHYHRDSNGDLVRLDNLSGPFNNVQSCLFDFRFNGKSYRYPKGRQWKSTRHGLTRLYQADRIRASTASLNYLRRLDDFHVRMVDDTWYEISGSIQSRLDPKIYVVQTSTEAVARCLLMTTDPGDLVLDPTCGSGTTAYAAEQWGRRWITIDTSRVALALARARIMGARYPYYLLADSKEGQQKEAEVTQSAPSTQPTHGNIRHGFVYERVPHITLKSIANNAEIDVIWEKWQPKLSALSDQLTAKTGRKKPFEEWEVPREADEKWSAEAKRLHAEWWEARIARQQEIDASIAAKAEFEYLYDKPYEDKKKVRVAGPFTVESLSPHRMLGVDENDELIDPMKNGEGGMGNGDAADFTRMILENLKTAGVQQAHKEDRIAFTSLVPWPGQMVCAEGKYLEGDTERRAAIFIGPEFGTVQRQDLVQAAREAGDADFDVLIACAFNYEAHATEFNKLGRIPVLKARMNADLHMAEDLKNTGKGNLFVIFGEPDIVILPEADGQIRVKVNGVVRSDGADGIACWFIDADYNDESFFVRHAYFLGASDPYKSLKTTLKAEINADAWESLHSDTSRPFPKPKSGKIAVKVINHLGDEVMKVFRVD